MIARLRQTRAPVIVVFDVERLTSHTSADDHAIYRTADDLQHARETGDPLQLCEAALLQQGVEPEALQTLRQSVIREVALAEQAAFAGAEPPVELEAKKRLPVELTHPSREVRGTGEKTVSMRQALRDVLLHRLQSDPRVVLFGEDIEDPKGDVFGVTRGLSSQFPGRVLNSPLSESTILGTSIGRALAGQRPVAFIQFADFLPLAQNQIAAELAMLYWRTAGRWEAPVIVMAPCGAYRPGLGPYHAQTGEATWSHIPGLDVFMPCTAADAAGLLNAAFESGRPTLFLYPKALLNDMTLATARDVERQFVPIGPAQGAAPARYHLCGLGQHGPHLFRRRRCAGARGSRGRNHRPAVAVALGSADRVGLRRENVTTGRRPRRQSYLRRRCRDSGDRGREWRVCRWSIAELLVPTLTFPATSATN